LEPGPLLARGWIQRLNAPTHITPDILIAQSAVDFADGRALFTDYAASLGVDLTFQDFAGELRDLQRMYGAPSGCLLLARSAQATIGCIGVRALSGHDCEMKRLYVRDVARGSGLGRTLALRAIDWARAAGYQRMCLDTLADMSAAQRLYAQLGFVPIEPYYRTPLSGTLFMALELTHEDS
jgi:GNAT superfamily N-acetyltransferase